MIKLTTGQFAIPQENVYSITKKMSQEGSDAHAFFALELSGENTHATFLEIEDIFRTHLFHSEEEFIFRFEKVLKEINDLLEQRDLTINGVIAVQEKDELHISQSGEGEAYLVRRGKLTVIIENIDQEEGSQEATFINIASGEIMVDDRIVLASLRLLRYAMASQITKVLSEGVSEGLEEIQSLLEIEAQKGSVVCAHARGESLLTQMDKVTQQPVPRALQNHWATQIAEKIEILIDSISQKTGHSYERVKTALFACISVFFLFFLIWGIQSLSIDNTQKEEMAYAVDMLEELQSDIKKARNNIQLGNYESAQDSLDKIKRNAEEIFKTSSSPDLRTESSKILSNVEKLRDKASKITRISNPEERISIKMKEKLGEEKIQGILVQGENTYVYTEKSLFQTVLDSVNDKEIISEEANIIRGSILEKGDRIFVLSSGAFIKHTEDGVQSVSTSDEEGFKKGTSEQAYSRFLYVLSSNDNQIWKYEYSRGSFSGAKEWLSEEADLSQAIDFAIDGSIYVLKNNGDIALFHKGKESSLTISGIQNKALDQSTKIFVQPEMKHVYVLNPSRNSVIQLKVINKGLEYAQEYIFETQTPLQDMYIDQAEQRMIVTDEENVYTITL
ncbi:hypothetical protein COB57_03410 [Candidatus Peregrinibacteria bacterium]|nr:MAG: hypothetical protein COB57_03410 [Candidatus Peregrinibacteria bacterium]